MGLSTMLGEALPPDAKSEIYKIAMDAYKSLHPGVDTGAQIAALNVVSQANTPEVQRWLADAATGQGLSPEVRQAALSLLTRQKYDKMPELLEKLSKTETDPAVQKSISDLKFAYAQTEMKKQVEQMLAVAIPGFDSAAQTQWLHDRFPLLNQQDYEAAVKTVGDNSMGRFMRFFSSESTIEATGLNAMRPIADERARQWEKLVQLALTPQGTDKASIDESNKAKAILYGVVSRNAEPLATPGDSIIPWRQHLSPGENDPLYNPSEVWQQKATEAMDLITQSGVAGRPLVESFVKDLLIRGETIPSSLRVSLLKAWEKNCSPLSQFNQNPTAGSSFMPMSEYVSTLRQAYIAEKRRIHFKKEDFEYQNELERIIKSLPGNLSTLNFQ
jgi:hypothetical protein